MDARYCPLCGSRNECSAVAGEGNCWCAAQPVRPEVLRRLSPEALGVACVCRVCAWDRHDLDPVAELPVCCCVLLMSSTISK